LRPLIILEKSKMEGVANLKKIEDILAKGENVVILSNHQTEADPQVLYLVLLHALYSDLFKAAVRRMWYVY
jgi:glycerol-3-phosphate O-acyltransferase